MDGNIISPYVRVAMYSSLPQGFVLKKRIIYDYELIYVRSGSCKIVFDDNVYECKKNDAVFIRPGVSHAFFVLSSDGFVQPHIHFDPVYDTQSPIVPVSFKDRCDMTYDERMLIRDDILADIPIPTVFVPENTSEFRRAFFSLINLYISDNRNILKIKSEMLTILDLVIKQFSRKMNDTSDNSDRLLRLIKEYIDANHMNIISLDDIADQFSCNKFTVIRKFKEKYGKTVISYYNTKRFETAQRLLGTTTFTVKDISEALNFSDEYTFSRFFKNRSGVSPTLYRENIDGAVKRM